MTIYGGYTNESGVRIGGFFVSCTQCGWHSTVVWYGKTLYCKKCGNKHHEGQNIPTKEEYTLIEERREG